MVKKRREKRWNIYKMQICISFFWIYLKTLQYRNQYRNLKNTVIELH